MNNKTIAVVLLITVMIVSGCEQPTTTKTPEVSIEGVGSVESNQGESFHYEGSLTEKNQKKLHRIHDIEGVIDSINHSNELENLLKRFQTFNDPTKVSYICLIDFATIIECQTIQGKVSSVDSAVTASEQIVPSPFWKRWYGQGGTSLEYGHVVESPQLDGSGGTNGDGIFWYDTLGNYHEWNGLYKLSDVPFVLAGKTVIPSNPEAVKYNE